MRTCTISNSLINPLIYCWIQKEVSKVILRIIAPVRGSKNLVVEGNGVEKINRKNVLNEAPL